MPKIKISDITIKPRQRKEISPDDITEMAESLKRFGQIQNIIVAEEDGKLVLVAGFTRIQGAMSLGWEEIEAKLEKDLSPVEQKELELEENIRRKNLEWWEEAAAIAEIDEIRRSQDPNWSIRKTAAMLGKSVGTVTQSLDLKKAVAEDPTLKEEATLRGALNKRKEAKQIEARKIEIERKKAGETLTLPALIKIGDARDLIRLEADETFDAVVTNFPFGIEISFNDREGPYYDEEQHIIDLVQDVVKESFRVLKDDSWFVAWFDVRKITYSNQHRLAYEVFMEALEGDDSDDNVAMRKILFDSMGLAFWLEKAGFSYVTLLPSIWVKPNKRAGTIGDPRKGLVMAYEAMIFAAKGDAILMKKGLQNIFVYDTPNPSERLFEMQMPDDLCAQIVSMVSLGGGRILDPFAGSGSIGIGALECQCEFLGFELDPERASNGNLRLAEHIFSDKVEGDRDGEEGGEGTGEGTD